jgi:hypothetical protein
MTVRFCTFYNKAEGERGEKMGRRGGERGREGERGEERGIEKSPF